MDYMDGALWDTLYLKILFTVSILSQVVIRISFRIVLPHILKSVLASDTLLIGHRVYVAFFSLSCPQSSGSLEYP